MQLAMRFPMILVALVAVAPAQAVVVTQYSDSQVLANPVRKVVTLLQSMQKKVTEEGEAEKKLYEKFMCYCKTGSGKLDASISALESKVPAVGSDIEEAEGKLAQSKATLKEAQDDRVAAKAAMGEATGLREKEAKAFAAEKAEEDADIAAVKKAIAALDSGMAGSFLQTEDAQVLRQLAVGKQEMLDSERQLLVSFLSAKQGSEFGPKGAQISGILKDMGDTMAKSLAEATAAEETSIKSYEALMAAKTKEVKALTATVEAKTTQIGELGVKIAQLKGELSDSQEALLEDKKFRAGLRTSCDTKTVEWEERSKTRTEELLALAETIKVLNDDDALDLFKKTLPSASAVFVQVGASAAALRARAVAVVRKARRGTNTGDHVALDLLALALAGKKAVSRGGFEKIVKMIDSMVEVLKKEQEDDGFKREYCSKQLDAMDDKKKLLERTMADEEVAMATVQDDMATQAEEIQSLEAGIKALDKMVVEATEQRKAENAEYKELMASNSAAKDLLGFAKNRLNKFYNPKLYSPPPKQELTRIERISVNFGGEAPTEAPGGIANTGIAVLSQLSARAGRKDAPPPPPETWSAYAKKSQESSGVLAMIDLLVKDLEKEMAEAEVMEKDAQAEYETMTQDSAEKRVKDSKSLGDNVAAKADMEGAVEKHKASKGSALRDLMATEKYIASLHGECDWLLQYFDVRKEARAAEMDSLKNAKAVLSGADYSLFQARNQAGFLQRQA